MKTKSVGRCEISALLDFIYDDEEVNRDGK